MLNVPCVYWCVSRRCTGGGMFRCSSCLSQMLTLLLCCFMRLNLPYQQYREISYVHHILLPSFASIKDGLVVAASILPTTVPLLQIVSALCCKPSLLSVAEEESWGWSLAPAIAYICRCKVFALSGGREPSCTSMADYPTTCSTVGLTVTMSGLATFFKPCN